MDELGNILREAREARGLSLDQVYEHLRISQKFLAALETGQYDLLPSMVHGRGFLRNYARFLSLDPEPLLERYEVTKPATLIPQANPLPGHVVAPPRNDQPFFDPVNMEIGDNADWRWQTDNNLRRFLLLAMILFVVLVATRFVPLLLQQGEPAVDGQAIEQILNSGGDNVNNGLLSGDLITSTSRNVGPTIESPEPTRPPLPATMETIQLRLNITERTWLRITIDGEVVFEGLGRKNDLFEYEAFAEAQVLTGNAAGVHVTINEIALNRMGGRGESAEEIWRTTGN